MLTILDGSAQGSRYCDGISRRGFLKIGTLGMGGLALPDLLRAEAASQIDSKRNSHKAIIMILLTGGPPHQDMYDLKPEAPSEFRGEFQPISTSLPGFQICELLPRMAKMMDKLVVIRSLADCYDQHNMNQVLTGWESHPIQGDSPRIPGHPQGGWPTYSSAISKIQGAVNPAVPAGVNLMPNGAADILRATPGDTGYLSMAHSAFAPNEGAKADFVLDGISLERLHHRKALLSSFDRFRRSADASGQMEGMDAFSRQAFGVLTSSKLAEALDLEKEDPRVKARYGIPNGPPQRGGAAHFSQLHMARRLVQEGARCVTATPSRFPLGRMAQGDYNWDWHKDNFGEARVALPMLDQAVTALIEDLEVHDMLDDVTVCVWGEFGRTPRINQDGGRDHWPAAAAALLAGGGLRTGQVIGATSPLAEYPVERPVRIQEVLATLYHNVGIDVRRTTLTDLSGRPHYLVESDPIPELI